MTQHPAIRLRPSILLPSLERVMIKPFLGFITLIIIVQLASCSTVQASEQITAEALAVQIEQGTAPLILDVRTAEEYQEGHIPGAINIHFKDIPNQLDTVRAFNSSEVVVYCERGFRAGVAENLLAEADFSSVIQLTGDMPAWRAAALPIAANK